MQPYQNFTAAPYQQPMYQSFNQPMQISNPYIDRINQLQQYQQGQVGAQMSLPQQQAVGLNGKIVDDFGSVTGNDVPMDGVGAVFLKSDGSEIQRRVWDATNGSIVTTSYKPEIKQNPQEGTNIPQMNFDALNEDFKALRGDIAGQFNELFGKIEQLEKSIAVPSGKQNGYRNRKDGDRNE